MTISKAALRRNASVVVALALTLGAITVRARQEPRHAEIWAEAGRPVARAIEELERRHRIAITYEELQHVFPLDTWDMTAEVRRDGKMDKKVLAPAGRAFAFSYDGIRATSEVEAVLRRLIATAQANGNSAGFDVRRTEDTYHVVPVRWKDAEGDLASVQPLLDTQIATPSGDQTALNVVHAIVDAVSKARGIHVIVGVGPLPALRRTQVSNVPVRESARAALMRTLQATGLRLSWQLFCDGGATATCVLNLHTVGAASPGR